MVSSRSALEGQQRGASVSVSINSSYSSPQVPAPFYHGAPRPALSFPSELSQTRPPTSHRRLPIPPVHVSPSPSASTSSSSLSLPTQLPTSRRHSYRPLPKRPESRPELLEAHKRRASIDERSSPMTPATPFVPQHPTNIEEIRRGNLTKLRRHLGSSVPSDLVTPRVNGDETSGGSRIDAKVYGDLSKAPITTERLSTKENGRKDEKDENLVKNYSSRWLREKKGRRWAEDNYNNVIQSLREL
ncbi:hypothetical protein F5888DRAFT_339829 [Russula emetica]|nr:hypothetical protein F5888DRAFT_339829 [Russula emetica]